MNNVIKKDMVQVIGVTSEVSDHIVTLLTRSALQLTTAPIIGIVIEYQALSMDLKFIVTTSKEQYHITATAKDVLMRVNNAMNSINSDSCISSELKQMALQSLEGNFELILNDLASQLRKQGACYTVAAIPRKGSTVRTKEQRAELLIKAHILDKDGYYVERFFSKETIRKDKARHMGK